MSKTLETLARSGRVTEAESALGELDIELQRVLAEMKMLTIEELDPRIEDHVTAIG